MVKNLLNKYIWLVDTIYRTNGITFEEINKRWLENDLSEGFKLPKRTFHKWRIAIEDLFGLVIDCKRKNGYQFFIHNKEDLSENCLTGWLFNTLSIGYKLEKYKTIENRIILENVFTGGELLSTILDAIRCNTRLLITYKSFHKDTETIFEVEPYCLKIFQQRWYLVARSIYFENPRIYALDRILNLQSTGILFEFPNDFSPKQFFASSYGIIVDETVEVENIDLKVHCSQVAYLRSLPLHSSQQEMEQAEEYSIFRLMIAPTFDFEQKILSMGEYVEVLAPLWFRKCIVDRIKRMKKQY
ncbi:MAG: WYL domain-containing protein [Bacteroidales bacterium]|nr:WYL domain-containing protein [Bacteroidales bacterium]